MSENPPPPEGSLLGKAFDATEDNDLHAVKAAQKLFEERKILTEQAEVDPLTQLLNKTTWSKELEERIEANDGREFGVMFIDLKDFKRANDEHGHEYGDKVLKQTARVIKRQLRSDGANADVISFESREDRDKSERAAGRLGGDEFAIILDLSPRGKGSELTLEERMSVAKDRLMKDFFDDQELAESGVGISIGTAPWEGQAADELLKQADASMYEHKQDQREESGTYR